MAVSIEDRLAIEDLIQEFFWLYDRGRADETSALFASDACLTFGTGANQPGTFRGAKLIEFMTARAMRRVTMRHAVSNIALSINVDGSVQAYLLITAFRAADENGPGALAGIADFEARLVREAEVFRIAEATITPVIARP